MCVVVEAAALEDGDVDFEGDLRPTGEADLGVQCGGVRAVGDLIALLIPEVSSSRYSGKSLANFPLRELE